MASPPSRRGVVAGGWRGGFTQPSVDSRARVADNSDGQGVKAVQGLEHADRLRTDVVELPAVGRSGWHRREELIQSYSVGCHSPIAASISWRCVFAFQI